MANNSGRNPGNNGTPKDVSDAAGPVQSEGQGGLGSGGAAGVGGGVQGTEGLAPVSPSNGHAGGHQAGASRSGNAAPGGASAIKRLEEQLFAATEPWGLSQDPARLKYPNLWEHLTVHTTSTGQSKEVATLAITATPTGFQATCRDMTYSVALVVDSESLEGLLGALEAELSRPMPRWKSTRHGKRANAMKSQDAKKLAPWDRK